jgi:hypothetical protein
MKQLHGCCDIGVQCRQGEHSMLFHAVINN